MTYTNDVVLGSSRELSANDCEFSIKCAKQPVAPPITRQVIKRTLGTRSSLTILVHPRFSKSSVECKPASVNLYPYNPTYVNAHGLNRIARLSTQDVKQLWMQWMHSWMHSSDGRSLFGENRADNCRRNLTGPTSRLP